MQTITYQYCEKLNLPLVRVLESKQIKLSTNSNIVKNNLELNYNQLVVKLKGEVITAKSSDSNIIKPSLQDLTNAFYKHCNMSVLRDTSKNKTLFIYDPRIKLMDSSISYVEQLLGDVSSSYIIDDNGEIKETQFEIIIDDIKKTSQQLVMKLKNNSTIRDFEKLPPNYVVTLNDIVIDLYHNHYYDLTEVNKYYDIVNRNHFNFTQSNDKNKENTKTKSTLHRQIIDRVMKDWSNNDEEVEYFLYQIIYSILQNDNHNKAIILIGSGGNGKSTFMGLLRIISGEENTIEANLHQFGDSNAINKINMSTKVVIGDDLATNCKIGSTTLSHIKSIITCNPISVPVKYQDNVVVQTNALIIQATNTEPSLFENNAAMKARLILVNWTNEDFRSTKSELTFNLDKLMKDQSFIDDWVMMCLEKIEYFDEFKIPDKVKQATEELIENNDTIKQFLDENWSTINKFEKIPIKLLYAKYTKWCKDVNPKGGMMKLVTFTKELNHKSEDYNFYLAEADKRKSFKKDPYIDMLKIALDLTYEDIDLSRQSYIESLDYATTEEIDHFLHLIHPLNHELNDKEYQLAMITCIKYNRKELISLYNIE